MKLQSPGMPAFETWNSGSVGLNILSFQWIIELFDMDSMRIVKCSKS